MSWVPNIDRQPIFKVDRLSQSALDPQQTQTGISSSSLGPLLEAGFSANVLNRSG